MLRSCSCERMLMPFQWPLFVKHKTLVQLEVGTMWLWSPGFTLVSTFDSEAF